MLALVMMPLSNLSRSRNNVSSSSCVEPRGLNRLRLWSLNSSVDAQVRQSLLCQLTRRGAGLSDMACANRVDPLFGDVPTFLPMAARDRRIHVDERLLHGLVPDRLQCVIACRAEQPAREPSTKRWMMARLVEFVEG